MIRRLQLATASLAALASLLASGVILAGNDPAAASPLAALNPQVAARTAQSQFALSYADSRKAAEICADKRYRRLARRSAAVEPMMGDALAAMTLSRRCAGQQALWSAAQATEALNRRDLALVGLQLEEQMQLHRPDAAMATMRRMIVIYPELSDRLVPLLARVASEYASLDKVAQLVSQQSDWKRSFLRYAAANFTPGQVLEVRREYGAADADLQSIDKDVVATLARRGELAAAWSYFAIAAPAQARRRDIDLLAANSDYQPFGWTLSDSRELQVRPGEGAGELMLATLHLRAAGTLASQVYPAESATYVAAIDIQRTKGVTADVKTRCVDPSANQGWVALSDGQAFNPSSLGGGCRFAALRIDAASADAAHRREVIVRKVALTRQK